MFQNNLLKGNTEEAIEQKRALDRCAEIDQIEYCHQLTRYPLTLPFKKRTHFNGSNRGNHVGPVMLSPKNELWHLTVEQKKVYGTPPHWFPYRFAIITVSLGEGRGGKGSLV